MDVRVVEAGNHRAAAEVDDLGRGERRLVDADPAGDQLAGDRERALRRHLWVERPDQTVLEDHAANLPGRGTTRIAAVSAVDPLTEEQREIRDLVRALARERIAPRAAEIDK